MKFTALSTAALSLLAAGSASAGMVQQRQAVAPLATKAAAPVVTYSTTPVGCFADKSTARVLTTLKYSGSLNTLQKCASTCGAAGFTYAGLENGSLCYCSKAVSTKAMAAPAGGCAKACTGDKTQQCGALNQIMVYSLTAVTAGAGVPTPTPTSATSSTTATTSTSTTPVVPPPTASVIQPSSGAYTNFGCYANPPKAKLIISRALSSNTSMTVDSCIASCQTKGYPVAGLAMGTDCYCSTSLANQLVSADPTTCNYACSGDLNTACGGLDLIQVYSSLAYTPLTGVNANYPKPPPGATLWQFQGCGAGVTATVPMFLSVPQLPSAQAPSTATTVYVVTHGAGRDFQDSFPTLWPALVNGTDNLLIAPNFYNFGDVPDTFYGVTSTWYNTSLNAAWSTDANSWAAGSDATSPRSGPNALGGAQCSSFDVYDNLVASFQDKTAYPNLKQIRFIGHSGGAAFTHKYSMMTTADKTSTIPISYMVANAPSSAFLGNIRVLSTYTQANTPGLTSWPYGFDNLFRYPSNAVAAATPATPEQIMREWAVKDVTILTGEYDTYRLFHWGDQSAPALAQGGENRRDRGYGYWAHLNMIMGSGINVSKYPGYLNLSRQKLQAISPPATAASGAFLIKHCVVPNVGHVDALMYSSQCGLAALAGLPMPYDGNPLQPTGDIPTGAALTATPKSTTTPKVTPKVTTSSKKMTTSTRRVASRVTPKP